MKKILNNAFISLDGVDISDHSSKVTIESKKDEVDVTGFGASSKTILLGLGDGTITVDVFQDFDAASVDDTIWPIHSAGSTTDVVVRADAAAVSATNPEYRMTGVIPSYNPIDGQVGAASTTSVAIRNAADAGITRATA